MKTLFSTTIFALTILLTATSALAAGGNGDCPYSDLTREERFTVFDADADGFLNPAEFPGPQRAFDCIDADDDGLISLAEWLACPGK